MLFLENTYLFKQGSQIHNITDSQTDRQDYYGNAMPCTYIAK